jgi:hypothetical protein
MSKGIIKTLDHTLLVVPKNTNIEETVSQELTEVKIGIIG